MITMTKGMLFSDKRDYVNVTLREALSVVEDFGSIEYVRSYVTEQELVKLTDSVGVPGYFNVTGLDNEQIFKDIVTVVLLADKIESKDVPDSFIADKRQQKLIAPLFG